MTNRYVSAFFWGAIIGVLGGLIGLGGAEFRLPVLLSLFHFHTLEAVILNKATSLVVVAFALPFRAGTIPLETVLASWPIIVNLLSGSLLGAWLGAGYATRLSSAGLQRIIAILLVLIDGTELAKYMFEYNVGVAPASVYEVKKVDMDFFEEDEMIA